MKLTTEVYLVLRLEWSSTSAYHIYALMTVIGKTLSFTLFICLPCTKFVTTPGLSVFMYHSSSIYFVYKTCMCMNLKYLNLSYHISGVF